jgi:hypothetical protein
VTREPTCWRVLRVRGKRWFTPWLLTEPCRTATNTFSSGSLDNSSYHHTGDAIFIKTLGWGNADILRNVALTSGRVAQRFRYTTIDVDNHDPRQYGVWRVREGNVNNSNVATENVCGRQDGYNGNADIRGNKRILSRIPRFPLGADK